MNRKWFVNCYISWCSHLFAVLCILEQKNSFFFFPTALSREPFRYPATFCLSTTPSKPSSCCWKRELLEKSTTWERRARFPSCSLPRSSSRWWEDSKTRQTRWGPWALTASFCFRWRTSQTRKWPIGWSLCLTGEKTDARIECGVWLRAKKKMNGNFPKKNK